MCARLDIAAPFGYQTIFKTILWWQPIINLIIAYVRNKTRKLSRGQM